jgi:hypothetical protein
MSFFEGMNQNKKAMHDALDGLQIKWARRLEFDFGVFNYQYLSNKLKKPTFKFFENESQWGYWKGEETREIGINLKLIFDHEWESVLMVLKHEMAHQFVDEILGGCKVPHGEEFQKACKMLCVPFHAACSFSFNENISSVESSVLRKIKKMFALAGSSNENEARTAMVMANNLLLKHNISIADVENKKDYVHKYVGEVLSRTPGEYNFISNILSDYFFVLTIWMFSYDAKNDRKGSRLELSGSPENVEIAEYVYHYLINQIENLWQNYKRENNIGHQKFRKSFIMGVLMGFKEKLQLDRATSKERGLIWLGDPELNNYYHHLHPRIKTVSTGGHNVYEDAKNEGYSKGKNLNLHLGLKNNGGFGGHLN